MYQLSATDVRRLMRQNRKTIRGIATRWHLTQQRVREVRARGVQGEAFVLDWLEILTTPGGRTTAVRGLCNDNAPGV